MEDEKLGKEPAFATSSSIGVYQEGMSKRFYAACMAMQGLISKHVKYICITKDGDISHNLGGLTPEEASIMAYEIADELLKQENN